MSRVREREEEYLTFRELLLLPPTPVKSYHTARLLSQTNTPTIIHWSPISHTMREQGRWLKMGVACNLYYAAQKQTTYPSYFGGYFRCCNLLRPFSLKPLCLRFKVTLMYFGFCITKLREVFLDEQNLPISRKSSTGSRKREEGILLRKPVFLKKTLLPSPRAWPPFGKTGGEAEYKPFPHRLKEARDAIKPRSLFLGGEGTHCYTTHDKSQNMLLGNIPFVPRLILGHIPPRQLREWRGREKFARQSRFFLLLHFHFPIFALFPPSEFPFVFPPALQTFGGRGGEEDDGANCGKVGIACGAGKWKEFFFTFLLFVFFLPYAPAFSPR